MRLTCNEGTQGKHYKESVDDAESLDPATGPGSEGSSGHGSPVIRRKIALFQNPSKTNFVTKFIGKIEYQCQWKSKLFIQYTIFIYLFTLPESKQLATPCHMQSHAV